ncbi:transglycosylase, partial [Acinetobacter baumannii]|nr:transglycosylase [Acinetobacter baumannii]
LRLNKKAHLFMGFFIWLILFVK